VQFAIFTNRALSVMIKEEHLFYKKERAEKMDELMLEIKRQFEMLTDEQREVLKAFVIFLGSNCLNLESEQNQEFALVYLEDSP
jgi:hypothetical protein